MSYIDVAIPGLIGLAIAVWPQLVFVGSRVTPDQKKLQLIRKLGAALLVLAIGFQAIRLAGG